MTTSLPGSPTRWLHAGRATASILALLLILLVGGCGGAEAGDEPVSWPELVVFDDIAYRAEGFARSGDVARVEELHPRLVAAGRAVTAETIPSNVADRPQVEAILADLTGLVDRLAADEASAAEIVLGTHAVTARLMAAAGMPHVHATDGPNGGLLHPVFGADGTQVGTVEIRLDPRTGDVEAWLTEGGFGGDPWRLPLETTMELGFVDLDRTVTLAVRDRERNEDAPGRSTIVDGATASFAYPGGTGEDASWLTGADFAATTVLRFDEFTTAPFVLRPPALAAGGGDDAASDLAG